MPGQAGRKAKMLFGGLLSSRSSHQPIHKSCLHIDSLNFDLTTQCQVPPYATSKVLFRSVATSYGEGTRSANLPFESVNRTFSVLYLSMAASAAKIAASFIATGTSTRCRQTLRETSFSSDVLSSAIVSVALKILAGDISG